MTLYMVVSADEYELPMIVSSSARDIASFIQQPIHQVYQIISRNTHVDVKRKGIIRGYNILKVDVEEDEE